MQKSRINPLHFSHIDESCLKWSNSCSSHTLNWTPSSSFPESCCKNQCDRAVNLLGTLWSPGAQETIGGLPRWLSGKESACQAGEVSSIPGSGKFPGEENGSPHLCSCLGNSMDRGAWWATVRGVAKNRTWPSTHTFFQFMAWSQHSFSRGMPRCRPPLLRRKWFLGRVWELAVVKVCACDSWITENPSCCAYSPEARA